MQAVSLRSGTQVQRESAGTRRKCATYACSRPRRNVCRRPPPPTPLPNTQQGTRDRHPNAHTMSAEHSLRRTEAKAFFANERTFLHWMNMSVTLGSISAALLGVSGVAHKSWGKAYEAHARAVRAFATLMMCLSIFMAGFAAHCFRVRGDMLMLVVCGCEGSGEAGGSGGRGRGGGYFSRVLAHPRTFPPTHSRKADGPYDSRVLPIALAVALIVMLLLVFGGAVAELVSSK